MSNDLHLDAIHQLGFQDAILMRPVAYNYFPEFLDNGDSNPVFDAWKRGHEDALNAIRALVTEIDNFAESNTINDAHLHAVFAHLAVIIAKTYGVQPHPIEDET